LSGAVRSCAGLVAVIGVDPVTVAALPGRKLVYLVDADRSAIYVVNTTNGASTTT
jgi:hypothetical protein